MRAVTMALALVLGCGSPVEPTVEDEVSASPDAMCPEHGVLEALHLGLDPRLVRERLGEGDTEAEATLDRILRKDALRPGAFRRVPGALLQIEGDGDIAAGRAHARPVQRGTKQMPRGLGRPECRIQRDLLEGDFELKTFLGHRSDSIVPVRRRAPCAPSNSM